MPAAVGLPNWICPTKRHGNDLSFLIILIDVFYKLYLVIPLKNYTFLSIRVWPKHGGYFKREGKVVYK